jgi:hypothetical protein
VKAKDGRSAILITWRTADGRVKQTGEKAVRSHRPILVSEGHISRLPAFFMDLDDEELAYECVGFGVRTRAVIAAVADQLSPSFIETKIASAINRWFVFNKRAPVFTGADIVEIIGGGDRDALSRDLVDAVRVEAIAAAEAFIAKKREGRAYARTAHQFTP